MRPDDLRGLLQDAAADQPPVSPTARNDVLRRARRHRVRSGVVAALTVAALVGVGLALAPTSPSSTRVATDPAPPVPPPPVLGPSAQTPAVAPSTTVTTAPPAAAAGPSTEPVPAD